jgi:predicted nuclease of predicted toxin-antitoxin system
LKFLVDNALPPKLAELLVAAGYDAVHVRAYGMQDSKDQAILVRAEEEERIIVSADTDFAAILASQALSQPSFILFRDPNFLRAQDYADALLPALPTLESEVLAGCVAVFRSGRLRIRRLPFGS